MFQYIRILFAANSCCIFLTFLAVAHMIFYSHSGEILELAYVSFQFYLVTFLCENIHTSGQYLKFEYMKLLTKTTLSLRSKNDFSHVRAFSWFSAELQSLLVWWLKFGLSLVCAPRKPCPSALVRCATVASLVDKCPERNCHPGPKLCFPGQ